MLEGKASRRNGPRPSPPVGDTGRLAGRNRGTDQGTYQNHKPRTHDSAHARTPVDMKKRNNWAFGDGVRESTGGGANADGTHGYVCQRL